MIIQLDPEDLDDGAGDDRSRWLLQLFLWFMISIFPLKLFNWIWMRRQLYAQDKILLSSVLCRTQCGNVPPSDGTNCENLQANRIVNTIERHYSVDGLQFHVLVKLISFKISISICTRQQQYRAQLLKRLVIFCLGIFYFLKYICPGQYLRAPLFTH